MAYRHEIARPRRMSAREETLRYPFASLVEAMLQHGDRNEKAVAAVFSSRSVTYRELMQNAQPVANSLFSAGVDRGGRCALVLDDGIDLLTAYVAISMLGAAPVVLDPSMPVSLLLRRVRDVRGDVVLCGPSIEEPLQTENLRVHSRIRIKTIGPAKAEGSNARVSDVQPSREDLAGIVFSPGTAGQSMPVVFRHRQFIHWTNAIAERLDIGPDDIVAVHRPMFASDALLWSVVLPAVIGIPCVHLPSPDGRVRQWFEQLDESKATILITSDQTLRTISNDLSEAGVSFDALRTVVSSGEASRHGTIRDIESTLERPGLVRPLYSLTESSGAVAAVGKNEQLRVDSEGVVGVGRVLNSSEVAIFDGGGGKLDAMNIGEIHVRGESLFLGYFDTPERTQDSMRDGWFRTGDIGYFDDDEMLFILGRGEDMIRTNGQTFVPRQIEESADRVHNVRMLAAIGKPRRGDPSPDGQEDLVVVAEIEASASGDRDRMRRISENITAAVVSRIKMAPAEVLLVEPGAIPRTTSGKVMYGRLRYLVTSGRLGREGAILHGGNVFISPLKR